MKITVKMPMIKESDLTINLAKLDVACTLDSSQEELKRYKLPEKKEGQSEEEYVKECKEFMLHQIEKVSNIKQVVFSSLLDRYNDFLASKRELLDQIEKRQQENTEDMEKITRHKKENVLINAGLSLLFPQYILAIIAFAVGRNYFYNKMIKMDLESLFTNEFVKQDLEKLHTDVFDLVCTLRSDYHESKSEFEKLKKRALNGENILQELYTMLDPERVSLERPERIQLPNQEQEKQKVLVYNNKKKSNE